MGLVDEFLNDYNKQYDYYEGLCKIVADLLDSKLKEKGIRAIVSSRAKNPTRLKNKLEKIVVNNNITELSDIKIHDLSGVRVALYFPDDREKVEKIICDIFECYKIKQFPKSNDKATYKKRFSGYWATHYHVRLTEDKNHNVPNRFFNTITEIQVASVLMHAWAEVEHDLVYKPLSGELTDEEKAILDELNGLVMAGEIALEQLHKAIDKRISLKEKFDNQYDLASYINNEVNNEPKIDTGNIEKLYNFMNVTDQNRSSLLKRFLSKVDLNKPISKEIMKESTYADFNKYKKLIEANKNRKLNDSEYNFINSLAKYEEMVNQKEINHNSDSEIKHAFQLKDRLLFEFQNVNKDDMERCTKVFNEHIDKINKLRK